jgi:hypothetical protein
MAIKFLNKANANDISIVQKRLNVGSNEDPDVLLHLRANARGGETPIIRLQDTSGSALTSYLDIGQNLGATLFVTKDSFNFSFSTAPTDTVFDVKKRVVSSGAQEGAVGILQSSPNATLDVNGGVRIADDPDVATESKAGTMRYREVLNGRADDASLLEMCMLINVTNSVKTYDWVTIKENTWA